MTTETRFATINDVTAHLIDVLCFDENNREDVERSIRENHEGRYEDLVGDRLERLERAVWDDVTCGAEWPY